MPDPDPDPAHEPHAAQTRTLAAALHTHARCDPSQAALVQVFLDLLEASAADAAHDPFRRERVAGHFTGSAWVVSADGLRTLLTHHRKLDRWLQPGGHADGERDLAAVALREAEEETGLERLAVEGDIFDLDRHWIPEHKGVPAHWHHDLRYVVRCHGSEVFTVSAESHALAWRAIADLAADADADASLRRMATRWLSRSA